jgi:hypothetical protein
MANVDRFLAIRAFCFRLTLRYISNYTEEPHLWGNKVSDDR